MKLNDEIFEPLPCDQCGGPTDAAVLPSARKVVLSVTCARCARDVPTTLRKDPATSLEQLAERALSVLQVEGMQAIRHLPRRW